MRISLFNKKDKVLLVGEGNFSFAVTLAKYDLQIELTATCYEKDIKNDSTKENVEYLKNSGIRVLLGVDATKFQDHPILCYEIFNKVVFNFPHVGGKMRIEKNRNLLKNFFLSVRSIVDHNSLVLVTLCDGQGGTLLDTRKRKWNDSWQITEMAAHGDFLLINAELFNSLLFDNYLVTGYRSLEKKFNTQGSIVHILQLFEKPNINNIAPKEKLNLQSYFLNQTLKWEDIVTTNVNLNGPAFFVKVYVFDLTLVMNNEFNVIKFYEIMYNCFGLIIKNVELLDSYHFSDSKISRTFRITYESKVVPLHRKIVLYIHEHIIHIVIKKYFNIE